MKDSKGILAAEWFYSLIFTMFYQNYYTLAALKKR